MPFWTYMLHCRGGAIYTGHTDDLDASVAAHQAGEGGRFTRDNAPCTLLWSEEFATRDHALTAESRIKAMSHPKKLALVHGDDDAVLALKKSKSSPAASSERTAGGQGENTGHPSGPISGTITAPARLDKALADATNLSRARVQGLIAQGHVQVGGAAATSPSAKVAADTPFSIALPPPEPLDLEPQNIPLEIVFEDDHLAVVNKPAGMVVHPAAGNPDGTLVNALLHHCAGRLSGINGVARPGIVHRIDKDTSGLLVIAKTDAAHEGLAAQFADHSIHRRYLAVCAGEPKQREGTIAGRIGRSDGNRKKMAVLPDGATRGKDAVTHYKVIAAQDGCALIECRLETGRTHQIRVHCASIGHPLLGDQVYGRSPAPLRAVLSKLGFARQALHAAELGFVHPATEEAVQFKVEMPADMRELIDETVRSNR